MKKTQNFEYLVAIIVLLFLFQIYKLTEAHAQEEVSTPPSSSQNIIESVVNDGMHEETLRHECTVHPSYLHIDREEKDIVDIHSVDITVNGVLIPEYMRTNPSVEKLADGSFLYVLGLNLKELAEQGNNTIEYVIHVQTLDGPATIFDTSNVDVDTEFPLVRVLTDTKDELSFSAEDYISEIGELEIRYLNEDGEIVVSDVEVDILWDEPHKKIYSINFKDNQELDRMRTLIDISDTAGNRLIFTSDATSRNEIVAQIKRKEVLAPEYGTAALTDCKVKVLLVTYHDKNKETTKVLNRRINRTKRTLKTGTNWMFHVILEWLKRPIPKTHDFIEVIDTPHIINIDVDAMNKKDPGSSPVYYKGKPEEAKLIRRKGKNPDVTGIKTDNVIPIFLYDDLSYDMGFWYNFKNIFRERMPRGLADYKDGYIMWTGDKPLVPPSPITGLAHEIGHILGWEHDNTDDGNLMHQYPESGFNLSLNYLHLGFARIKGCGPKSSEFKSIGVNPRWELVLKDYHAGDWNVSHPEQCEATSLKFGKDGACHDFTKWPPELYEKGTVLCNAKLAATRADLVDDDEAYCVDLATKTAKLHPDNLVSNITVASSSIVIPPNVCRNGITEPPNEECDDNNNINEDLCTNACQHAICGDTFTQDPNSKGEKEQCDDGNKDNTDACTEICLKAICGDGHVWKGVEECDDGNKDNTDSCVKDCKKAKCGDGFIETGKEECDDGNNTNNDGCNSTCVIEFCGDETVQPPREQCEFIADCPPEFNGMPIADCEGCLCFYEDILSDPDAI